MNVSELFELTHWITREIEDENIPQKYQAVQTILQQHAQPNQQKTPFETQKDDLIDSLKKILRGGGRASAPLPRCIKKGYRLKLIITKIRVKGQDIVSPLYKQCMHTGLTT